MRDMRKAFIQGQWAWGANSKAGHRAQDIEFKGCRVAIVRRAMNAEDDASRRSITRRDFVPIDIRRDASGKRRDLQEVRARYVGSDHCTQCALRQYGPNSAGGQRGVRHW